MKNIDLSVWLNHTKALGHAIATFATDVSGVPKLKEGQKLPLRKLKITGSEKSSSAVCESVTRFQVDGRRLRRRFVFLAGCRQMVYGLAS
jgi:hypothetical protein